MKIEKIYRLFNKVKKTILQIIYLRTFYVIQNFLTFGINVFLTLELEVILSPVDHCEEADNLFSTISALPKQFNPKTTIY